MKSPYIKTCCVVDQFCKAPANLEPPVEARCTCFVCGQAVCSNCSSIRSYYHYGKVRMCNSCQVEYDGDDKYVMKRLCRISRLK